MYSIPRVVEIRIFHSLWLNSLSVGRNKLDRDSTATYLVISGYCGMCTVRPRAYCVPALEISNAPRRTAPLEVEACRNLRGTPVEQSAVAGFGWHFYSRLSRRRQA